MESTTDKNAAALNDNNKLLFLNDAENGVIRSYRISPTDNQFLKLSIKFFGGRTCFDFRKWKRDVWYGTKDFYPSNQGITVDISSFDDILHCMIDIQSNHLLDKSIR